MLGSRMARCRARAPDRAPRPSKGECWPPGRWNQKGTKRPTRAACQPRVKNGPAPRAAAGPGDRSTAAIPATQRGWPPPPQPCRSERPWPAGLGLETERAQAGQGLTGPFPAQPAAGRVDPAHPGRAGGAVDAARTPGCSRAVARPHGTQSPRRIIPSQSRSKRRSCPCVDRHGSGATDFRRHRFCGATELRRPVSQRGWNGKGKVTVRVGAQARSGQRHHRCLAKRRMREGSASLAAVPAATHETLHR